MNFFARLHYRQKLTLIVSVALLVPLLAACLLFGRLYTRQMEENIRQRLEANLNTLSMFREHLSGQLDQNLTGLANDNTLQVTSQLNFIPQLTNYLRQKSTLLDLPYLQVLSADGNLLAGTDPLPEGCYQTERPRLQRTPTGAVLCARKPIRRDDKLIGYIAGGCPLNIEMATHIENVTPLDPFLITIDGRIVLSNRLGDSRQNNLFRAIAPTTNGTLQFGSKTYRYTSRCNEENGQTVCGHALLPLGSLHVAFSHTTQRITTVALLIYCLSLFFLHRLVRGLAAPIRQLSLAARKVESGNFDTVDLDLEREDEFGLLNRSFARMAITQQNYAQRLEQEVAQRTAELEKANKALRQDILARQKAEMEKSRLEEQLRQTQKMEALGTLAGGIAHDFNNILMPILCLTDLARKRLPEEDQTREMLDEVLKAAHRARDLISQILSFSRPDKQKKQPINLAETVTETIKLVRASTSAGIDIRFEISAADIWVDANGTQMQQMLLNLCTNAVQAMGEKGQLEVRLEKIGEQQARLTVRDDGPGMSEEVREHIFEPFFTTKATGRGTGMGLSVVHGIVTHHQGSIRVDSTPGEGACFEIILPLCSLRLVKEVRGNRELPHGTERLLVVDDERAILAVWQTLFEELGYQVVTANDPERAMAMVADGDEHFDLLITDQNMPGMSGAELAMKMRQSIPRLPVIICTGYSESCTPEDALLLGFDRYLTKPCNTTDLAMAVREVLDQALTADRTISA
ncbi:phospho-acceptor domain-containing protein [Geothermobacter ehrlichii]|uniref:histidine kinase n=1 Tax=Geothermobacter ehrlichii TaxID=213224 RepID=A0A5D3WNS6_9BACT|nr:ATP-binding protein [Geothermobacter ehrlichii]TYO99846.1 phospho-acceptor domain-containing protein [Geothermobacter ehrlichii]